MSTYQLRTFADIVSAVREELQIQSTDTTAINRIKRDINIVLVEVGSRKRWFWLNGSIDVTVPAYLNAGTVTVTQNSNVATLSIAPTASKAGCFFAVDGYAEIYKIDTHVAGSVNVQLSNVFTGSTMTGSNYKIWTNRVPLPIDCKETSEVWHETYRRPLENIGRQEYRRVSNLQPRNEGAPLFYFTGDYVDPGQTSTIASLPTVATRASTGIVKKLVFGTSLPTSIATAITQGEPTHWQIAGAGDPSYNGQIIVSGVSTTNAANDTITYTGIMALTEAPTADLTMTIVSLNQEQDYQRYREMFIYPCLSSSNLTLHVDYYRDVQPLNNDSDEPLIPIEDRSVLLFGALEKTWARIRNKEESDRNAAKYVSKLTQMEGKWQDSTETARLVPSKNYLGAKRAQGRKWAIDSSFGGIIAGGMSSGQNVTGTASRAAQFGLDGVLAASPTVTTAELSYVHGVTSPIQTQINNITSAGIQSLTGDVTAMGPGAAATTVVTVGGSTAANIHAAEQLVNGNEGANKVFASPNGATGAPSYRPLVGADLPAPASASLGGVLSSTATTHQWVNSISTAGAPVTSQPAFSDISGTVAASQLPAPTASTLGGIESVAATSHQWINSISTAGVPTQTQPAFSDISGTVAASQLPTPTASTLGGVESIVPASHQWINSISTSGVPTQTQPAFTDVSGSVASTQMPALTGDVSSTAGTTTTAIGTNKVTNSQLAQMTTLTIKGNNTGSTANAADLTGAQALAVISPLTTKGDLPTFSTLNARFGVGSDATVLTADSSQTTGLRWATPASAPSQPYETSNLGLSVSAASGILTVNLKQSDGATDASSANPIKIGVRSSSATTGSYNQRLVTAALSQTLSSGTTLGMLAAQNNNLWVYAIDSDGAGTMKLGLSTIQWDENSLQSTVAESFTATCTSASPGVWTATGHGLNVGDSVQITTTGTVPGGFTAATTYWVSVSTTNTFQLSTYPASASINTTSTGTGTQTIHIANPRIVSAATYTNVPVRLIGRLNFNLTTSGTWIAPTVTSLVANHYKPEFIHTSYQMNTAQTYSTTSSTLIFDTRLNDTHGLGTQAVPTSFTATTTVILCVQPGWYSVSSNIAFSPGGTSSLGANNWALNLFKTPYVYAAVSFAGDLNQNLASGSGNLNCFTKTGQVYCNAYDLLFVSFTCDVTGTKTFSNGAGRNMFNVTRIGD